MRARVAAALLALALAGCSDSGPSSFSASPSPDSPATSSAAPSASPAPKAAKPPPRPRVGACYRMSFAAAVAPTSRAKPVPCRSPHQSQTAYVGTVDAVVDGHLLAVDSARVQGRIAAACPRRVAAYLGASPRDLRTSLARAVWFSPTLAQSDAGASWFRCDVIVLAQDGRLASLGRVKGALAGGGGEYGVCGTAAPGDRGFRRVACARPHSWRAIGSYDVGGSRYPGASALRDAGADRCKSLAEQDAASSLDFEWALDWPTEKQWEGGQRWGLCWAPD